jgi:hypothetical protein
VSFRHAVELLNDGSFLAATSAAKDENLGAAGTRGTMSSFAVIKPVDFRRNQASGRFSFSA